MPHRMMMRAALLLGGLAALLTVVPRAGAAELEAVFRMIPDNAQAAMLIPQLDRFNTHMAQLNRTLKLDVPGMGDVLDEFRRTSGMNKGINDKGGIIVVLLDISKMGSASEPPALMLVPVSDYGDFVGNFEGNPRAAVTPLKMPWGQTVHCKQSSDYAVLSASSSLVEKYQAAGGGQALSGAGPLLAGELNKSDVVILMDSATAGPTLKGFLQTYVTALQAWLQRTLPEAGSLSTRLSDSVGGVSTELVDAVLRNTELVALSATVEEQGVSLTLSARYKAGSTLAQVFTPAKNEGRGLAQLPDDPYLVASSVDLSAVNMKLFAGDVKAALDKHKVPMLGDRLNALAPLMDKSQRGSSVTYIPRELSFNSQIGKVIVIDSNDPRAFKAAFRAHVDGLNNQTIELGPIPSSPGRPETQADIKVTSQYTANAQLIDGIEVDRYSVEYNIPPQVMAALGRTAGWIMLLSGREQKGFIAVMDKSVLLTTTDDMQLLRKLIAASKNDNGLGVNPGIEAARPHLPEEPAYAWYFSVADVVRLYNQASKMMNAEAERLPIVENLPPMAMGIKADGKSVVALAYVPMSVIRGMQPTISMIRQTWFAPEQPEGGVQQQNDPNAGGGQPGGVGPGGPPGGPDGFR